MFLGTTWVIGLGPGVGAKDLEFVIMAIRIPPPLHAARRVQLLRLRLRQSLRGSARFDRLPLPLCWRGEKLTHESVRRIGTVRLRDFLQGLLVPNRYPPRVVASHPILLESAAPSPDRGAMQEMDPQPRSTRSVFAQFRETGWEVREDEKRKLIQTIRIADGAAGPLRSRIVRLINQDHGVVLAKIWFVQNQICFAFIIGHLPITKLCSVPLLRTQSGRIIMNTLISSVLVPNSRLHPLSPFPSQRAHAQQSALALLIRHDAATFSQVLQLFPGRGVFQGKHSIALKTLLCFLSIFALITAIALLDGYRLDGGVLSSSFAVAALFAFALTEGHGPARPALSAGLARRGDLVIGFESAQSQPMKRAA